MKEAKVILTEQEEKLDKTTKQFGLINDGIKKSNEETEKIKQQITVCNESKNQIIEAMRKLNGISQDNSASMEETAASMEELNTNINILSNEALKIGSMSKNLSENIAVFKL